MKKIIEHIYEELMDAQTYSKAYHMSKDDKAKETYRELAGEELNHAERLIDTGDKLIKTPEEDYLWKFERERALDWWKRIKHDLE